MELNTSVWGEKSSWVNINYGDFDAKAPSSDRDTLTDIYANGYFELNQPMDWSISPWGINAKSMIIPAYFWTFGDRQNGFTTNSRRVHEFDETLRVRDSVPFILQYNASAIDFGNGNSLRSLPRYTPEVSSIPTGSSMNNVIISDFNYQKIFLVVEIGASSGIASEMRFYTARDYFDYYYTQYPYFRTMRLTLYTGDVNNRDVRNGKISFVFDIKVDNILTENFWCPYDNAHILYTPFTNSSNPVNPYWNRNYREIYDSSILPSESAAMVAELSAQDIWGYGITEWFDPITWVSSSSYEIDVSWFSHVDSTNIDEFKENILREVAYLGLPFRLHRDNYSTATISSPDTYLPLFDEDGVTTGEYALTAEEKADAPNSQWEDNIAEESGYDWSKTIPKSADYDAKDEIKETTSLIVPSSLMSYLLTQNEIIDFLTALKQQSALTTFEDIVKRLVSIRKMPWSPSRTGLPRQNVTLGSWDSGVEASVSTMVAQTQAFVSTQTVRLSKKYDNFLDYPPFTSLTLYVPYCGTMELDASIYMGHNITVKIAEAYDTGEVMAYIFVDGHLQDTMTGMGNVDIPLSGELLGTYAQTQLMLKNSKINNAATGVNAILGNVAGASVSASFGNVMGVTTQLAMGAANSVKYVMQNQYLSEQQNKIVPSTTLIQKGSSSLMYNMEDNPCIWITRVLVVEDFNSQRYGNTYGYACWKTGKLKDFLGLTVVDSPNLTGLSCTKSEADMIEKLLTNGVRL